MNLQLPISLTLSLPHCRSGYENSHSVCWAMPTGRYRCARCKKKVHESMWGVRYSIRPLCFRIQFFVYFFFSLKDVVAIFSKKRSTKKTYAEALLCGRKIFVSRWKSYGILNRIYIRTLKMGTRSNGHGWLLAMRELQYVLQWSDTFYIYFFIFYFYFFHNIHIVIIVYYRFIYIIFCRAYLKL